MTTLKKKKKRKKRKKKTSVLSPSFDPNFPKNIA